MKHSLLAIIPMLAALAAAASQAHAQCPLSFAPASNYAVGNHPLSVAVGDFNADGRPDLAVANFNSNNVSVLLNTTPSAALSQHPAPVSTCPAGAASFSVTATGGGPITYRWQRETSPGTFVNLSNGRTTWDGCGGTGVVFGSTTRSLVLAADTEGGLTFCSGNAVRYRCIVTNSCGSATSDPATLTICIGDADCDGDTDSDDVVTFFTAWDSGEPGGDADADGDTDSDDIIAFFAAWDAGC